MVLRDNPTALPRTRAKPKEGGLKRGLSPFMRERNNFMQAAKRTKGSTLTAEEVERARDEFRQHWGRIGDKGLFSEAYQEWRHTAVVTEAPDAKPYRLIWGGGCTTCPVTKEELFDEVQRHGWPTDHEVVDPGGAQFKVPATTSIEFNISARFNLWGLSRAARNVRTTDEERAKFAVIEKGIFSFLEHVGREQADRGDLLIMVVGDDLNTAGQSARQVAMVTGVTYNPKVFEVTQMVFAEEGSAATPDLTYPFKVYVANRPCKITSTFQAIDTATSDEFIAKLLDKMVGMRLFRLVYDAIIENGSNKWCLVKSAELVGDLLLPGQAAPLRCGAPAGPPRRANRTAERMFENLLEGDPLNSEGMGRDRRGGRATGGGGRGRP